MVPLQAYQYTWGSASRYKGIDISTMSCHLDKHISESVRLEFLNVEVSGEKSKAQIYAMINFSPELGFSFNANFGFRPRGLPAQCPVSRFLEA